MQGKQLDRKLLVRSIAGRHCWGWNIYILICRFWSATEFSPWTKSDFVLCKRLPAGFDSTISLFADDTIAYLVIKSNSDALSLERDLDKLAQWEQLWEIAFYPDKWNVLTISRSKTSVKFNYCFHGHVLESVEQAKYPGVAISEDFKWYRHIKDICGKTNQTHGCLLRNLNIASISVKEQLCKSLVKPSLEHI